MPWKDVTPMDQKLQFVSLAATGRFTITQLCDDFDISRKTGHKWLARHATHGAAGLKEHSRRPHGCSHGTLEEVRALIIKERKRQPTRPSKGVIPRPSKGVILGLPR
jgi:transposase-like protein